MIFSADQIIGKTLIARQPVDLTRTTGGAVIYTVQPGETVGTVYSFLNKNGLVYWLFYDNTNRTYYAKHEKNLFDINALKEQGAKDIQTEIKEEEEKEKTTGQRVESFFNKFLLAASVTAVLITLIRRKK
jgi:hypothetical protein